MRNLLKVLVLHPQIQYSHRLAFALQKKKYLIKFITSFWYKLNKNKFLYSFIFKINSGFKKILEKRYFNLIDEKLVQTFPYFEIYRQIYSRILKKQSLHILAYTDSMFDNYASNQIKKIDPDIVIAFETAAFKSFKIAKNLKKVTILDLAQIHYNEIKNLRDGYVYFKESIIDDDLFEKVNKKKQDEINLTDYFFCVSDYAKQSLINNGISENKIYVNEMGFDTSKFLPKSLYKQTKPFNILFTGTITRRKGIHLILEAFKQLNLLDCNLTIIGPMGDAEDLIKIENPYFKYIPFLSHDELVNYYQNADIFVFPSFLDSFAMVVLEAMACGTPVIVSENTGSKCAVSQGGGFVIPVNDVDAIKEKILFFYNDRQQLEIYGNHAAEIAQQYTWEKYYEKIEYSIKDIAIKENLDVVL